MWVIELYANLSCRRERQAEDTLRNRGGTEAIERYINAGISGRDRSVEIPHSSVYRGGVLSLTMKIYLVHEANKSGIFNWVAPALVGGVASLTGNHTY